MSDDKREDEIFSNSRRIFEYIKKAFHKAISKIPMPYLYGMYWMDYEAGLQKRNLAEKIKDSFVKQVNACIDEKDVKLFYRLYFKLLDFVNSKKKVVFNFQANNAEYVDPQKLQRITKVFWEDKEKWIDLYIQENPDKLTNRNLNMIRDFKYGLYKSFYIVAYESDYTVFNDDGINYMIKGLFTNLDGVLSRYELPIFVTTALFPFKGKIIYDSIMDTKPISFGLNTTTRLYEEYQYGQKVYNLLPENKA